MSRHPGNEVRRRFLTIHAQQKMFNQNIFRSPKMPLRTRKLPFNSLILSKLTYGAGSWQQLHAHTSQSWRSRLVKMYGKVNPLHQRGPRVTTLDTIAAAQMAHPLLVLATKRLSLFDRVVQTELTELFALLQAQDANNGWLAQVCQDLLHIQPLCQPSPAFEFAAASDFFGLANYSYVHPRALTKLGKYAVARYVQHLRIWEDLRVFQSDFEQDAIRHGAVASQHVVSDLPILQYTCDWCPSQFDAYAGLCAHAFQKHNSMNIAQHYAEGAHCL